ncbi:MAG: nucleotidyltransferase domain-containing protein [Chloroflexi bacterium]|nr:nucleotidyltransferase domain-containing protein [Chloroflexota bacterium]
MTSVKQAWPKNRPLAPNEQTALEALINRLRQEFGDDLLRVVLYGSKARGDADSESDMDLLVVARLPESTYWERRKRVVGLTCNLDLEHGVLLSTILVTEPEYAEMRRANLLFNRNVQKDGVELWTSKPAEQFVARIERYLREQGAVE